MKSVVSPRIVLSCLLIIFTGCVDMSTRMKPLREVGGWARSERPRKVNRRNIFDYMNGAGELYLAYSFVSLDVWSYTCGEEPGIVLEVYEMEHSPDAFGVLSFDLRGEEVGIGQRSAYAAGLLRFWKGRHFVRILAEAETPATRAAVLEIGRDLAAQLPGEGTLPGLVARLPQDGLLPDSIHYFHTRICLDYFYYLADDNILKLSAKTNAVIADYETPSGAARLMAVEYDSEESSIKAWETFHGEYLNQNPPEEEETDSQKIEGEQWVSSQREGKLVLIVFEGKNKKECEELLRRATSSLLQGG